MKQFAGKIKAAYQLTKEDALGLLDCDLEELCKQASSVREHFWGDGFELCTIINGKSGKCTEDCKFCAQSAKHSLGNDDYPLLEKEAVLRHSDENAKKGILRYSIVTSGRKLSEQDTLQVCKIYSALHEKGSMSLCASHGLLSYEQMLLLRKSGVTRYHNNLETSRRFFTEICTSHSYDEKIETLQNARRAGLSLCSGGIFGMGETMEDRIDLVFTLCELQVDSVPINILNAIPATPLYGIPQLLEEEIRRMAAIYRLILPKAVIRLAGGRGLLKDKGKHIFQSGVNAAISGNLLTTSGIETAEDKCIIADLNYKLKLL